MFERPTRPLLVHLCEVEALRVFDERVGVGIVDAASLIGGGNEHRSRPRAEIFHHAFELFAHLPCATPGASQLLAHEIDGFSMVRTRLLYVIHLSPVRAMGRYDTIKPIRPRTRGLLPLAA